MELAAPDTVNTMLTTTLGAVADHGRPHGITIAGTCDAARAVFEDLRRVGLDFEDIVDTLEQQGLASFAESWDELIASVTDQLEKAGAEVMSAGAVKPVSGDDQTSTTPASAAPQQTAVK